MNKAVLYDKYYFTEYCHTYYRQGSNGSPSPRHFIAYMKNGTAEIKTAYKTLNIQTGDVFYIPKGMKYYSYWYGNPDVSFLSIGFEEFEINGLTDFDLQKIPATDEIVDKLFRIPLVRNEVDCRALSLFYDALDSIIPHLTAMPESRDNYRVEKIKGAIRNNPKLSMEEIAKICSISEPYMYSLFKEITGITPNNYRLTVLCDMAVELLTTTDRSVEDISDSLGFSSSSYFRKVLFKNTGKTPREIKKLSSKHLLL